MRIQLFQPLWSAWMGCPNQSFWTVLTFCLQQTGLCDFKICQQGDFCVTNRSRSLSWHICQKSSTLLIILNLSLICRNVKTVSPWFHTYHSFEKNKQDFAIDCYRYIRTDSRSSSRQWKTRKRSYSWWDSFTLYIYQSAISDPILMYHYGTLRSRGFFKLSGGSIIPIGLLFGPR